MATNENNLTHDEIWDDSALVESWNEALEEYKVGYSSMDRSKRFANCLMQKYHSIHTKGGNVNDLIEERFATSSYIGSRLPVRTLTWRSLQEHFGCQG